MCSEVKGLRSAMSTPADLLLSGALAKPASTIVQPNCFEDPISSPTGAIRCVATKPTIEKLRVARGFSSILSWFADNHPVVTTCVDRAQAPMILTLHGRSCLSQQSMRRNGLMMTMMMWPARRLPLVLAHAAIHHFLPSRYQQRSAHKQ